MSKYQHHARLLWDHMQWPTDEVPHFVADARKSLKRHWFSWAWPDFFDAYEFSVALLNRLYSPETNAWFHTHNEILEAQGCAYRFIAKELVPITNAVEMSEVQSASECSIAPAAEHIREALAQMPPNPSASSRNSVKESISAVEAALKHLTGERSATLGDGLKAFEKRFGPLHHSIRRGLDHLYVLTVV